MAEDYRTKDSEILAKRAAQVQRGGARAAVLGVNDGLVSTLCIVLGVAAAGADQSAVLLAGLAGLIAGSISMAAGEWISVQSQVDLFNGVLNDLRRMIKKDKALLEDNLADHLLEDGYSKKTAATATKELGKDKERFFVTYAEQVIGVNPDELGSPWVAAISSFALFTLGALAPLAPWFFIDAGAGMIWSITLTAIGGLVAGGYVAYSSGNSLMFGSIRQFLIVLFASLVTYYVGVLFGTVI
ncbi:MAG TPA: VIT1/CCC1 transporter family protein [Candidatus Saccharibacteria bacterium]|nr:VIT1/CCC1 transporter family protein [Candidatus Saccharibacteria bacterium]